MTATDPLAGPFMDSRHLTDYSGQPGYAKRLPDAPPGVSVVSVVLARLDRSSAPAPKAA